MSEKLIYPHAPPRWLQRCIRWTFRSSYSDVALGDLFESYGRHTERAGRRQATWWLMRDLLLDLPQLIERKGYGRFAMIKNYIKVALRNMKRQKLYAAINIAGLAIGMAGCLLIYLWVQDELSFDRYHSKADRIYRVEREMHYRDFHGIAPVTGGTYGPAYEMDYPEVVDYARVDINTLTLRDSRQVFREQEVLAADASVFKVFDFSLETGVAETALEAPYSVVLTEEAAERYLGTSDVLGKVLPMQWNGQMTDFNITGILKPVPRNSHFHFDMAMSISTYNQERMNTWLNNFLYTYVLLNEANKPLDLEAQSSAFVNKHLASQFAPFLPPDVDVTTLCQMRLRPMTAIHLNPAEQWEIAPQGSRSSVMIFSAVAILILLIACVNFINLSTARASKRAMEVGLRKTVGAHQRLLWGQFLSETVLMATTAAALALIIIALVLPAFNNLAAKQIAFLHIFSPSNIWAILAIIVLTGIVAGLYPAFVLSSFKPASVLRGQARRGKTGRAFRRIMAVGQFIISTGLIVCTLVVMRQMTLVQNQAMGFDKENLVVINPLESMGDSRYQPFRNEVLSDGRFLNMGYSSNHPGAAIFGDSIFKLDGGEENHILHNWQVGYDFADTYKMKIISGRNLSQQFATDSAGVILNRAAVSELGSTPETVIGKLLHLPGQPDIGPFTVVGVVEDFHYKSLHMGIEPLGMFSAPVFTGRISIRLAPGDQRKSLAILEEIWGKHFPSEPFNFYFLDDAIMARYTQELRMKSLFTVFAGLSILVACLGLFGLASYTAQEKTKEIGIRKVLGAGIPTLVGNLLKEFTQWVLWANVVALPLSWYLMNRWLSDFAQRIALGPSIFILAAALALLIALATVAGQAIRAALTQPVKSLKYE